MSMRLLIADADASLADIYERFFSAEGHEVDVVADGLACVERARHHHPDVLVVQYELPWGGGDGVLACLRDEGELVDIGVVLVTCDHAEKELAKNLGRPVTRCLRKPFRLRDLSETVHAAFQSPSEVDPSDS